MTSATTPSLTLVHSFLDHPDARKLADQLDGELASIYGGPNTGRDTAVPPNLTPPHGLFLIGYLDDVAVACGGVRLRRDLPHAELTAEIKRMYVAPEARGRGYGAEILRTLEKHARGAGATRAVLEAGILSRNAVRLYVAAGYEMIEPYSGQYPDSRTNKGFSRLL
jgi:GNAT superfamily N-acetyltransferase